MATVQVRLMKSGPNGIPLVEIAVPKHAKFEEIVAAQKAVLSSEHVMTRIGLVACGGCKSGVDWGIVEQFGDVVNVEF